jgi:hypothetical protein
VASLPAARSVLNQSGYFMCLIRTGTARYLARNTKRACHYPTKILLKSRSCNTSFCLRGNSQTSCQLYVSVLEALHIWQLTGSHSRDHQHQSCKPGCIALGAVVRGALHNTPPPSAARGDVLHFGLSILYNSNQQTCSRSTLSQQPPFPLPPSSPSPSPSFPSGAPTQNTTQVP